MLELSNKVAQRNGLPRRLVACLTNQVQ
jgi:hypothetical protein